MHGNDLIGLLIGIGLVFALAGYLTYILIRPDRF
jgi:hypothetical protein